MSVRGVIWTAGGPQNPENRIRKPTLTDAPIFRGSAGSREYRRTAARILGMAGRYSRVFGDVRRGGTAEGSRRRAKGTADCSGGTPAKE
jgi:hypothetical protein